MQTSRIHLMLARVPEVCSRFPLIAFLCKDEDGGVGGEGTQDGGQKKRTRSYGRVEDSLLNAEKPILLFRYGALVIAMRQHKQRLLACR